MKILILTRGLDNTTAVKFVRSLEQNHINVDLIICEKEKKLSDSKSIFKYFNVLRIFNWIYENKVVRNSGQSDIGNLTNIATVKDKIVLVSNHNTDEVVDLIKNKSPDIILVLGTRILERRVYENTELAINFHSGIVPRYKGAHTVFWALRNGDWRNVGYVFHLVADKVDSGKILLQKNILFNGLASERSIFNTIEDDAASEIIGLISNIKEQGKKIKMTDQYGTECIYKGLPSQYHRAIANVRLIIKGVFGE